jgi:hypothetical protein
MLISVVVLFQLLFMHTAACLFFAEGDGLQMPVGAACM